MIAAITLTAVLMIGAGNAKAGFLLSDFAGGTGSTGCANGQTDRNTNGYTGIIVAGFTGIIVAGFTGIIVAGATGNNANEDSRSQTTLCRDGFLLSD